MLKLFFSQNQSLLRKLRTSHAKTKDMFRCKLQVFWEHFSEKYSVLFFNNKAPKKFIDFYQTDPKHLSKITLAAIPTASSDHPNSTQTYPESAGRDSSQAEVSVDGCASEPLGGTRDDVGGDGGLPRAVIFLEMAGMVGGEVSLPFCSCSRRNDVVDVGFWKIRTLWWNDWRRERRRRMKKKCEWEQQWRRSPYTLFSYSFHYI